MAWSSAARLLRRRATLGCPARSSSRRWRARAAISGSASRQPVGGLEQLRQVVEVSGDVGVVGPEALLVDGERAAHQRLGLGQPVGVLEQRGQVVEAMATFGCSGPKLFSSIARARRISGSASARRFVAWSNWARLLRRGDVWVFGSVAVSSIARARRISGSASARRFVSWSSSARLLRSRRRWDGPVQ